ncbi:hypothetical protein C5N14_21680 [Micromonospora sp. MW-13]|uniref:hypothetical protein n=1 Tax=Micromonospora sp. MW-13 TaxID=2094022 RepID=UPI000EE74508|nr:hypothetical protein [Micromonospora sp. MW-13]RGC66821.1 hypothetical protein C5N14_21680 [Micromonospora sp. MW-13]
MNARTGQPVGNTVVAEPDRRRSLRRLLCFSFDATTDDPPAKGVVRHMTGFGRAAGDSVGAYVYVNRLRPGVVHRCEGAPCPVRNRAGEGAFHYDGAQRQ